MVGIKTLALFAAASSVLAAPQRGHWQHGGNVVTQNDVVYTTVMVTVTAGQEPTPTPSPQYQPPETPVVTPSPEPSPQPEQQPSAQPSSSYTPSSGDSGYMSIVNKWRTGLGKPAFEHDSTLEANSLKTCDDSGGQLNHELNPGSMAQVLAPGSMDEFEKIFVGGWLCEMPNLPGLDGICATMSQGWSYDGQTGHAEIIDGDYSKCGCACASGICGCDFA